MERGTLDIRPTDDGYVLLRTTSDGATQAMPLSNLEVMELAQSATSLQTDVVARLQPSGIGAKAVVAVFLDTVRRRMI
jgi:hypothetical protein